MQTGATLVRLPGARQPSTSRACFYSPAPPAQRKLLTPEALGNREKTQALNRPPIWGRSKHHLCIRSHPRCYALDSGCRLRGARSGGVQIQRECGLEPLSTPQSPSPPAPESARGYRAYPRRYRPTPGWPCAAWHGTRRVCRWRPGAAEPRGRCRRPC